MSEEGFSSNLVALVILVAVYYVFFIMFPPFVSPLYLIPNLVFVLTIALMARRVFSR